MSISISQTPPSPQDPPRLLAEKLSDPDTWSTGTGEPDTGLLGQIREWPSTWPELNEWIDAVIADPRNSRKPIPAPPKRSLKDRLPGRRRQSRPKAPPAKAVTPASEPPLPPTDHGDTDGPGRGADGTPAVRRTVSWQNMRKPIAILATILVVLAGSPVAIGVGMRRTAGPGPAPSTSRRPDPRRRQALRDLDKSILEAERHVDASVSDPETISALKASISKAKRIRISRRIALTEIQETDRDLKTRITAVEASERKLESDRRRESEEARRQQEEQARQAEEAWQAEERRRQEESPRTPAQPAPRRSHQTPPRTYSPRRRFAPQPSRPAAPQRRQPPAQSWDVPDTGCTEGCL